MSQICDSHSEDYYSATASLCEPYWHGIGQAFSGNGRKLEKAQFYIEKNGNPTGNATISIWNIMWYFGSSAVPLYGSDPLATVIVDVSSLPEDKTLVDFEFVGDNQIILGSTTKYCLTVEYDGGSALVNIAVGIDHRDSEHPGNECHRSPGFPWGYNADYDVCFYVYTGDEVLQDIIGSSGVIPFIR